jgi:hypothetical protein
MDEGGKGKSLGKGFKRRVILPCHAMAMMADMSAVDLLAAKSALVSVFFMFFIPSRTAWEVRVSRRQPIGYKRRLLHQHHDHTADGCCQHQRPMPNDHANRVCRAAKLANLRRRSVFSCSRNNWRASHAVDDP